MARGKAKEADDHKDDETPEKKQKKSGSGGAAATVAVARKRAAQVVWLFFVLCALLLAIGALLIALDANRQNALVSMVLDGADAVDLGIFSRMNGIKEFKGSGAEVKNALLNWGLGAVAYLVVGKILDRVIRP